MSIKMAIFLYYSELIMLRMRQMALSVCCLSGNIKCILYNVRIQIEKEGVCYFENGS